MDEFKKKFARNLGEATEYSGKKMSYNEVADVLNSAGFKTSRGINLFIVRTSECLSIDLWILFKLD